MRKKRIRVNPYGASKSAREVAKNLGILRLKRDASTFIGRTTDVVINWGNGKGNVGDAREINPLRAVKKASDKALTLYYLQASGVSTPRFTMDKEQAWDYGTIVCRETVHGHSGQGIVVGTYDEVPDNAPLYTEYIDKVAEYRVIVCNGKAIDIKAKRKKNTPDGDEPLEYDEYVWNHGNNYVYTRNVGTYPCNLKQIGIDSVKSLELDFGAVDVIEDSEGVLYVLEVNSAFGLEGTTTELFCNELRELL